MAKDKDSTRIDTDPTDEILDQIPIEEDLPWMMGMWGTFTQWRCKLCPWDTLEGEEAILEHYLAVHAPPEAPKGPPIVLVADRFGNLVEGG